LSVSTSSYDARAASSVRRHFNTSAVGYGAPLGSMKIPSAFGQGLPSGFGGSGALDPAENARHARGGSRADS